MCGLCESREDGSGEAGRMQPWGLWAELDRKGGEGRLRHVCFEMGSPPVAQATLRFVDLPTTSAA